MAPRSTAPRAPGSRPRLCPGPILGHGAPVAPPGAPPVPVLFGRARRKEGAPAPSPPHVGGGSSPSRNAHPPPRWPESGRGQEPLEPHVLAIERQVRQLRHHFLPSSKSGCTRPVGVMSGTLLPAGSATMCHCTIRAALRRTRARSCSGRRVP